MRISVDFIKYLGRQLLSRYQNIFSTHIKAIDHPIKYIHKKTPKMRVFNDQEENRFYWISITRDKAVSLTT